MPGTAKEDMAMKNTKFIALIVAAALLVCGAVGIISSAEEKHMEIDSANVAYNDMMHLAFTLKNTDTIPEGAEAGVAIWNSEKSDYTAKNASFVTFNANVDEETVYYKSEGVAAPEIGNVIFVAACYKLNGETVITETPFRYSIVDYLIKRLGENPTDVQAELYQNVLYYGAASNNVLEEGTYVLVKAINGTVGAYNRLCEASRTLGNSYVLRAEAVDAYGSYFVKWVDAAGNEISTERVISVTPEKFGLCAYKAIYGNVSESAYSNAYSFNDFETGEIDLGNPDLTKAPTTACYGDYSGTNMMRWQVLKTVIDGMNIDSYVLPEATKNDEAPKAERYTFTKDENGNYVIGARDHYYIAETYSGNKYYVIERGQYGSGYSTTFMSNVAECKSAEIDFSQNEVSTSGVQFHINVWVTDGSESASYRLNLDTSNQSGTGHFYAETSEKSSGTIKYAVKLDGEMSTVNLSDGKTVSLKIVLNTTGEAPCFDYYIDGVYAGSLACETFNASGGHNASIDFSKARIGSLSINSVTAAKDDFYADNVAFK